jgi:hypothetical protein
MSRLSGDFLAPEVGDVLGGRAQEEDREVANLPGRELLREPEASFEILVRERRCAKRMRPAGIERHDEADRSLARPFGDRRLRGRLVRARFHRGEHVGRHAGDLQLVQHVLREVVGRRPGTDRGEDLIVGTPLGEHAHHLFVSKRLELVAARRSARREEKSGDQEGQADHASHGTSNDNPS